MASFHQQTKQATAKMMQDMTTVIQNTVVRTVSRIVINSPVDTGLFKGSYRWTQGSQDRTIPTTLDKQGVQTINAAVSGIKQWDMSQIGYLQNNQPYAIPLENGHSKQNAYMVRSAAQAAPMIASEEARKVKGGN